jgi:hypothetical protein
LVHRIDGLHHDGNARELAMHIRRGQQPFAKADFTFFEFDGLGPQHGVRKVQIELVRRHVGAFREVTQVAQITLVHHFPVILFVDAINLHGFALVDQVKQRGERPAQADAATATVADVEDPFQFMEGFVFVIVVRTFPVDGMACGSRQVAFACHGIREDVFCACVLFGTGNRPVRSG